MKNLDVNNLKQKYYEWCKDKDTIHSSCINDKNEIDNFVEFLNNENIDYKSNTIKEFVDMIDSKVMHEAIICAIKSDYSSLSFESLNNIIHNIAKNYIK